MARERNRHKPDASRWPSAPEPIPESIPDPVPDPTLDPIPDPIGRLDDVIATLEEMLDDRGVPPVSAPGGGAGRRSPELSELLKGPEIPNGDLAEPGTLPLLEDVVAPAANGDAEGTEGAAGSRGTAAAEPRAPLEPGPLSLGFEFVPDDPVPPIGDLDLDSPAAEPGVDRGGERYGDAPPPSLDPEVYRHLIDRLANEIDVIIQTGTEEAMERAATEIAARVREHVAIILPEVIEELVRMSDREPD